MSARSRLGLLVLLCALTGAVSAQTTNYQGGPVISNPQIVMVNIATPALTGNPTFVAAVQQMYAAIGESAYWMVVRQYATPPSVPGQPGTNQAIGAATYVGSYTVLEGFSPG